jgi:hypothetical protein
MNGHIGRSIIAVGNDLAPGSAIGIVARNGTSKMLRQILSRVEMLIIEDGELRFGPIHGIGLRWRRGRANSGSEMVLVAWRMSNQRVSVEVLQLIVAMAFQGLVEILLLVESNLQISMVEMSNTTVGTYSSFRSFSIRVFSFSLCHRVRMLRRISVSISSVLEMFQSSSWRSGSIQYWICWFSSGGNA